MTKVNRIPIPGGGTRSCRLSLEVSSEVWESDNRMKTALYVAACVVVPVLWGTLIHWTFQRIRRRQNSDSRSPDNWPDYQI